jgi:hypothetical protein
LGIILERHPCDGLDAAEARWIRRCHAEKAPLLNVRVPLDVSVSHAPHQLRLDLPFSAAERLRFPLRQWRLGRRLSHFRLAQEMKTPKASEWVMCALLERLEYGWYEVKRATPMTATRESVQHISRVTGLSYTALVYPSRYLRTHPDFRIAPPEARSPEPGGVESPTEATASATRRE